MLDDLLTLIAALAVLLLAFFLEGARVAGGG